jgi:hypothetical protein
VHGPLGQQLEDCGADVAALAASAAASTATAGAEAESESAARAKAELEAATARAEAAAGSVRGAEGTVMGCPVLTEMAAQVFAELAARLAALFMKCAPIARAEAKAEATGRWGEWVGHVC